LIATPILLILLVAAPAALAADQPGEVLQKKLTSDPNSRYALFVPPQARSGQPLPLIMALHGSHGDTDGPIRWWRGIATERGCFVCAPKSHGPTWPNGDQPHLMPILAEVQKDCHTGPKRVLLTGVSDGGTYCYILGFANPTAFRALAPVSAALPRTCCSKLLMMPKLPICVVHGAKDKIFPVAGTREAVAAMKDAHLAIHYIETPDGKHGWFPDKAAEILDWFEKLRTP